MLSEVCHCSNCTINTVSSEGVIMAMCNGQLLKVRWQHFISLEVPGAVYILSSSKVEFMDDRVFNSTGKILLSRGNLKVSSGSKVTKF